MVNKQSLEFWPCVWHPGGGNLKSADGRHKSSVMTFMVALAIELWALKVDKLVKTRLRNAEKSNSFINSYSTSTTMGSNLFCRPLSIFRLRPGSVSARFYIYHFDACCCLPSSSGLWQFSGIFQVFVGRLSGICQAFVRYLSGICQAFVRHLSDIC